MAYGLKVCSCHPLSRKTSVNPDSSSIITDCVHCVNIENWPEKIGLVGFYYSCMHELRFDLFMKNLVWRAVLRTDLKRFGSLLFIFLHVKKKKKKKSRKNAVCFTECYPKRYYTQITLTCTFVHVGLWEMSPNFVLFGIMWYGCSLSRKTSVNPDSSSIITDCVHCVNIENWPEKIGLVGFYYSCMHELRFDLFMKNLVWRAVLRTDLKRFGSLLFIFLHVKKKKKKKSRKNAVCFTECYPTECCS